MQALPAVSEKPSPVAEHAFAAECTLCFEGKPCLAGCDHCGKRWCLDCDFRWRITRTSSSLVPSCPFCRNELERMLPECPTTTRRPLTEDDIFDRLIVRLVQILSYVLLAMVLLLLPLVESYLTSSDELFLAYFCMILFVFVFLCCHYVKRHCPNYISDDAEDDDDMAVLSGV